jgi:transcription antitermination factor NusA-like protein
MLKRIYAEQSSLALLSVSDQEIQRYPYGARSEAAIYVGDLLHEEVPGLLSGDLQVVAIARRPGVLSKVAIRPAPGRPTPLSVGIGADHIAQIRDALDGERIHVVTWQRSAPAYIADALGLDPAATPPVVLLPALSHARVLLGEIDVRGIAGWRGLNVVLASALTGWRIRLDSVAATDAWARLARAMAARRTLPATVVGKTDRGWRVEVLGLYANLSGAAERVGQEIEVRATRMDPDEGRVWVSDRLVASSQLSLPLI